MKKTKVVIASVLKPIDDTRMYEKFGLSMAKANKYEVNIIGFSSKNTLVHESIQFWPHGPFDRTSWKRIISPIIIYKHYIKVKPDIIICNTHELLIVTSIYRILFGAKILYDVRENYAKNIRNTPVFHPFVKPFLAGYVRCKELISKPFFHGYLLAERIYSQQLKFVPKKKAVVIENKYQALENENVRKTTTKSPHITLLYSGTVSESNGVFEAITITNELHALDSSIRLRIAGYCALKKDLLKLKEAIQDKDYIELIGGDYLVPHSDIVKEIQSADFGFVLKKPNNGINDDKILTRLFEYTANQLPIILLNNPSWVSFCEEFQAAIPINPNRYDPVALLNTLKEGQFYTLGDTAASSWATEEPKLLAFIAALI